MASPPDTLIPFHLPYRQMIRQLPPRPVGSCCQPSDAGGMCGCDEEDEDGSAPAPDQCRRSFCAC